MRGSPPRLLGTALASAVIVIAFLAGVHLMLRRARNPNAKPRDEVERRMLLRIKNPSGREKLFYAFGILVAGAAPWLTYLLER